MNKQIAQNIAQKREKRKTQGMAYVQKMELIKSEEEKEEKILFDYF